MKTAYIFAGGELGNVAIDSEAVSRGANIVICADSGYKHALTLGIEPDVIVGDDVLFLQDADDGPRMYKRNSGYFSVFAITEAVRIRYLRGVKYPLGDYKMLRSFPIGVSNEITDDFALLSIDSGTALVIQQADTN